MVTDVAVTPGADAELAAGPDDDPLPHAAVITAMVAPAVATAQVLDLLISERIPVLLLVVDPLLPDH
jgi:multisubunit Na+/H+ antiporter MnhC subunit